MSQEGTQPTFRAQCQVCDAMLALPARLRRRAPHARGTHALRATTDLSSLADALPGRSDTGHVPQGHYLMASGFCIDMQPSHAGRHNSQAARSASLVPHACVDHVRAHCISVGWSRKERYAPLEAELGQRQGSTWYASPFDVISRLRMGSPRLGIHPRKVDGPEMLKAQG